MYIKYDAENIDEYNKVENLLLDICPHPDNDPTKIRYKKLPNELKFEIWFDKPSEMENFKNKIKQETLKRRIVVEIIPAEN